MTRTTLACAIAACLAAPFPVLAGGNAIDAIKIPGLQAGVRVLRDVDGMPHIIGAHELDVLRVQGWMHANDRLFQMDQTRRLASGTLSELLGPSQIGSDVELQTIGLRRAAQRSLDAASPEAREADLYWMNDVWQRFVADLAAARKLEPAALTAMINELPARVHAAGGDLGKLALDEKLVDGLKTAHEFEQLLVERGAPDEENKTYRQIDLQGYLLQVARQSLGMDARPQVAVVVASAYWILTSRW